MFDDACRALLRKPLIARMSTIDECGYPHTVPVWFKLDGDDLVVIAVSSTRKVSHIRANPKGALSIGGDDDDGGGYLVKGEFVIEPDPDDRWVRALCHQYEPPDKAEADVADWADLDIILLRLKPCKVYKTA